MWKGPSPLGDRAREAHKRSGTGSLSDHGRDRLTDPSSAGLGSQESEVCEPPGLSYCHLSMPTCSILWGQTGRREKPSYLWL
jgi:hypothetical protein